ncbi:hypothetical protein FN846DRAFT_328948 [Sphaerosporella brunnea]|uniref:Uncharacterized protein n=1 Tax=Sphaerosporella brunnea TaxID=1250544 RepID=A0A5J5EIS6_9PEZI|nr:hypothetical protein FN846DRAFT_328948 [Sphaerosporella brunnea]
MHHRAFRSLFFLSSSGCGSCCWLRLPPNHTQTRRDGVVGLGRFGAAGFCSFLLPNVLSRAPLRRPSLFALPHFFVFKQYEPATRNPEGKTKTNKPFFLKKKSKIKKNLFASFYFSPQQPLRIPPSQRPNIQRKLSEGFVPFVVHHPQSFALALRSPAASGSRLRRS